MAIDTLVGKKLGKYEIQEHIGRGGMAEVYKGYMASLDRFVAIKMMHGFLAEKDDFLSRFRREAQAVAKLSHSNIVNVYDFDQYGDNYYLVMEYITGSTLKDYLLELEKKGEWISLERTVEIVIQVSEALDYAHRRGMAHRDIKPANIMIDETGKAVLTDFGIVKMLGDDQMAYTATGALVGTPAYMSPEQALGKDTDERSDLYSLGVLLYQMTTGVLPFAADTPLAVVMKHVNEPTPLPVKANPDIPQALQDIILLAMAKDPANRFQTAAELAAALRQADLSGPTAVPMIATDTTIGRTQLSGTMIEPTTKTAVSQTAVAPGLPAKTSVLKSPWLLGLLAIVLVTGGIGGAFILGRSGNSDPTPTPTTAAIIASAGTPTTAATATNTAVPSATLTPSKTPDTVGTVLAAAELTRAAGATNTPTPTKTPTFTPTPSLTPNATATYLAGCEFGVELVTAYTYSNPRFNTAPVGFTFPMNWILKNSGSCDWPDNLTLAYQDGNTFSFDGNPISVDDRIPPDAEITLTASFVAPSQVGTYESTWQLLDAGQEFGEPIIFEVRTYLPATNTPRPTNTPAATATSAVSQAVDWVFPQVSNCRDLNDQEWRCTVQIQAYGGTTTSQFVIFIYDGRGTNGYTELKQNPGQQVTYEARARRCAAQNDRVVIREESTGTEIQRQLYVDPNQHYACTAP